MLHYLNAAAAQNHPDALYALAGANLQQILVLER
jgi:hypothetical protein